MRLAKHPGASTCASFSDAGGWHGSSDAMLAGEKVKICSAVGGVTPYDGQQMGALAPFFVETVPGAAFGHIEQGIVDQAGAHYTVSFAYSPIAAVYDGFVPLRVKWNSTVLFEIDTNPQTLTPSWTVYTASVVGTGNDTVRFVSEGNGSIAGYIDAVSVTAAVPEPNAALLLSAGLLPVLVAARIRLARSRRDRA